MRCGRFQCRRTRSRQVLESVGEQLSGILVSGEERVSKSALIGKKQDCFASSFRRVSRTCCEYATCSVSIFRNFFYPMPQFPPIGILKIWCNLLISLKLFCHQRPPEVQYNSLVQPQIQVNDASRVAMTRCGPIFHCSQFNWKIFS